VTTILDIVHKHPLTEWKRRETLDWFLQQKPKPRHKKGESDADYARRMVAESDPYLKRAADLGTKVHDMIERMVRRETIIDEEGITEYCTGPYGWYREQGYRDVALERPFASVLGYGGRIDVVVGGSDGEPENPVIIDWKTTKSDPKYPLKPWPSYGAQLVAYAKGICLDDAQLINVMISTTEPGRFEVFEWPREQHDALWMAFLQAFALWKGPLGKNYDPTEGSPF
jgi:hypothetical protein